MKSHFGVLWRCHYVITSATTFSTCKEKKIWVSCGTPFIVHFAATFTTLGFRKKNLFIIFYYVHYAMVMSKRSKISFQRYVHDAMIMKNIRFTLGFIKNTLTTTTPITPRSWQKYIFFLFTTTIFTTPWWWEKVLFPLLLIATTFTMPLSWQKYIFSFQHYVYCMMIMTKNILFFISVLRSLGPNH